ncbi:MAG: hypothetical protein RIQ33_2352 [Bacteroidota bacterium]|jgi:AAA15 family ATPase/GTPase
MFIEFHVGNFRSFRDIEKFSLRAAPLRANDSGLEEENVFEANNFRLLKSKAIIGSNASGKSNLGEALSAFALMVDRSVSTEGLTKQIWDDRFKLISDWDNQPIFFQYIFLINKKIYRYGFQILDNVVSHEWLFAGEKGKEKEIFTRTSTGINIKSDLLKSVGLFVNNSIKKANELYRPDSLFLTSASLSGNIFASEIREAIRSLIIIDGADDKNSVLFAMHILDNGTHTQKETLKKFVLVADTGIEDLEIREIESQRKSKEAKGEVLKSLYSKHKVYDDLGKVNGELLVSFAEWESDGTKKLFSVGSLILQALFKGRTIIIDEFDAKFHPNLTLKILELFHKKETNPLNAQLIFITHDASLLRRGKLRRDQICMVNKDKYGISSTKTLIQYKGVRKDTSIEKEYLAGSYDAVPYLDEIDAVIKHSKTKKNGLQKTK